MIKKIKEKTYNFLRRSQKYTGTDNVYLVKNGFWLTLGQVVSIGASFLLSIAFANLIDPIVYGNYKYIISILGILGIFSLPGISTAVTQAVARGFEGSFYSGFKTKLKWGCLGSMAAVIGAIYYWIRGNEILPIPLLLIAIFLPLMQASNVYYSFLTGKKFFSKQVRYTTITNILAVIFIAISLYFTKNLFWIITTYLISHTLLNLFFYLLTKNKFLPNKKDDPLTISYGKHLSFLDMISTVANNVDRVLLFTLIGSSQLAVYSFAIAIPDQINTLLKNINTLAFPKFSVKSSDEIKKTIIKKVWKLFLLVGIIIIIYFFASPYIYGIFFQKYYVSIPYSQLYILSLLALPGFFLGTVFRAKMMKKELYLLKITPFVRIALLSILIPFYGLWGAIIAVVITNIFNLTLIFFLFKKI
jgi:O-antigen/teichoic acid export membrane protein